MEKDIKNFVEEYNKRMSWNEDILSSTNINHLPTCDIIDNILSHYLSTEKITEESYDLENAKVFEYTDEGTTKGTLEMQVFSNKIYHTVYFWVKPGEDEETYKKKHKEIVVDEIFKNITELMADTMSKFEELSSLYKTLHDMVKLKK